MAAELWRWLPPAGGSFRLDSNIDGAQIVQQVAGRFMPPIRRIDDTVPGQPGKRPRTIVHDAGQVDIGLLFTGTTPSDLRANLRAWIARLDPTRGDGVLQVTGPAGDVRQLTCAYQDGLNLVEDAGSRLDQLAVVSFLADDPYWADITDSTAIYTSGAPATFFGNPFFPLNLGASGAFGTSTVTNIGDVPTYPVWVVTGPGTTLVLTNHTSGRELEWDGALGAGETLTIDARPGSQSLTSKSVIKNDGSNQFGLLSEWDFWPFEVGANAIEIEMSGISVASQVQVAWRPRYLAA